MRVPGRYVLATCACYGLFSNHWARDSLGAIESAMEHDLPYSLSVRGYNSATSVYFLPNIVVPIVAGILAQRYGSAPTYLMFFKIAALGNMIVGASVFARSWSSFYLLLVGRALMGIAYEAVDMMPIGFLAPRFQDKWSAVVGVLNGLGRLGSVSNFLLEPMLYRAGGLKLAIVIPCAAGASGLLTAALARRMDATMQTDSTTPKESKLVVTWDSVRSLSAVFWLYLVS